VWLVRNGKRVSILDLCATDRFTLLTGVGGAPWIEALLEAGNALGVPVCGVEIGPHRVIDDPMYAWSALRGVEEDGCVLVRPDRFVAWRCNTLPERPQLELVKVLAIVLGK
jgi:2,4-dichlorophenol 6-monooxygenase